MGDAPLRPGRRAALTLLVYRLQAAARGMDRESRVRSRLKRYTNLPPDPPSRLASLFRRQRDRSGCRLAVAGANVGRPLPRVLVWSQQVGRLLLTRGCGEVPLQVRHTPPAAGPRAAALADLARAARLMHADEIENLPLADVEAVTDCVVGLHREIVYDGTAVTESTTSRSRTYSPSVRPRAVALPWGGCEVGDTTLVLDQHEALASRLTPPSETSIRCHPSFTVGRRVVSRPLPP